MQVSGIVNNTGHSVVFTIEDSQPTPQDHSTGNNPSSIHSGVVGGGIGGLGGLGGVHSNPHVFLGGGHDDKEDEDNQLPYPGPKKHKSPTLNITGGPLSYRYRVSIN